MVPIVRQTQAAARRCSVSTAFINYLDSNNEAFAHVRSQSVWRARSSSSAFSAATRSITASTSAPVSVAPLDNHFHQGQYGREISAAPTLPPRNMLESALIAGAAAHATPANARASM